FVDNYAGFVVLRFFQGIFEACVLPSFVLMCSIWWTREEQSLRAAFWCDLPSFFTEETKIGHAGLIRSPVFSEVFLRTLSANGMCNPVSTAISTFILPTVPS